MGGPESDDRYWKLRPPPVTAPEDLCDCPRVDSVLLVYRLDPNPFSCAVCRREVPPERLAIDGDLAERIASWTAVYGALYTLWLDSGAYEEWAAARLYDAEGQVNRVGLEIAALLRTVVPTRYWWFSDSERDFCQPHGRCPACKGRLGPSEDTDVQVCHHCQIVI